MQKSFLPKHIFIQYINYEICENSQGIPYVHKSHAVPDPFTDTTFRRDEIRIIEGSKIFRLCC